MACGILAPRPGIEPTSPSLEGEVLTTRHRSPANDPIYAVLCAEHFFWDCKWSNIDPKKRKKKPLETIKSLGKIIENIFTIILGQEYSSLEIHVTTKEKSDKHSY